MGRDGESWRSLGESPGKLAGAGAEGSLEEIFLNSIVQALVVVVVVVIIVVVIVLFFFFCCCCFVLPPCSFLAFSLFW